MVDLRNKKKTLPSELNTLHCMIIVDFFPQFFMYCNDDTPWNHPRSSESCSAVKARNKCSWHELGVQRFELAADLTNEKPICITISPQ
jgi:hypothetical protein